MRGRHGSRGWPARVMRMVGGSGDTCGAPKQSREEERRRLMGGPGKEKKENKFEIQNGDVPRFKNSPNFYRK